MLLEPMGGRTMADAADIQRIAADVIADRLGDDVRIVSVAAREATDWSGDEVLEVTVVYDADSGTPDAKKTVTLIRHLRARLYDELAEERFPLISLISLTDAESEAA
jgi:hypothetical protein